MNVVDLEEYKLNKIKQQMIEEYSKYPIVGNYEVDSAIFDPEIQELMHMDLENED